MPEGIAYEPYQAKTILNKHKYPDHWFWTRYTAYPYIGCQHGCIFCYCREKKYAPYEEIDTFSTRIKVKENAPQLLKKSLMRQKKGIIGVGDYQPAEKKFQISRKMLRVCFDMDFPIFILERSPLVLRDMDLIQDIHLKSHATILFSIIHTKQTAQADLISKLEHHTPLPESRFKAMEKFAEKGMQTGISFMPILPELCDTRENIENVIKACADHGGTFVLAAPLTLADQQKQFFTEYLSRHLPDIFQTYHNLYPANSYGPASSKWLKTALMVRELCEKHNISDRMARPIRSGEKRALNKRVAVYLANLTYTMEIESQPGYKIWSIRKAAWAIENFEQDISLVYRQLGRKGLESIQQVGPKIGGLVEAILSSTIEGKGRENELSQNDAEYY